MKTYLKEELNFRLAQLQMGRSALPLIDQADIKYKCEIFLEKLGQVKHSEMKSWITSHYENIFKCIVPTHRNKFNQKLKEL